METVLDFVIRNEVNIDEFLCWLTADINNAALEELGVTRSSFSYQFLEFIRKQVKCFLNSGNISGLSPTKSAHKLKVSNDSRLKASNEKPLKNSSRTKGKTLDFSKATPTPKKEFMAEENSFPPLSSDPLSTPARNCHSVDTNNSVNQSPQFTLIPLSESPVKSISFGDLKTSTPRTRGANRRFGKFRDSNAFFSPKISEKKNVLGDYIIKTVPKKGRRRSSRIDSTDSSVQENSLIKSQDQQFDIGNEESFPSIGMKPTLSTPKKKRINPTLMSKEATSKSKNSFGSLEPSLESNAFLNATEISTNMSLDEERKLLKEQKMKQKSTLDSPISSLQDTSLSSYSALIPSSSLSPSVSKVSFKNELHILARIYASLILSSMVPNIMVELYFILQLLTVKNDNSLMDEPEHVLFIDSVHNCVYFAIKSLSLLFDCVTLLEKNLAKALCTNVRIKEFDPSLHEKLQDFVKSHSGLKVEVAGVSKSPIHSVSFQSETDNRVNFPTTVAFQMFKKQRDLFYEILRIWEDNHLYPGWSFSQSLLSKIRQIFSFQSDPTNLMHLARLFQSQLLTMCKGDEQVSEDAEDVSLLCQLRRQNPEKFQRLFERLVTPSKFGGPVPPPSFPGSQEFFQKFILVGANHEFNVHLRTTLISKITEVNDLGFLNVDYQEKDQCGEQLRSELSCSIQTLRLLAKYLGLLEFLPYQKNNNLSDILISTQITLRNKLHPPILLTNVLERAIRSGSLVFVVPWVVEMLSLADSVAFHTRYFLTILFQLILIFKRLPWTGAVSWKSSLCQSCSQNRFVSPTNSLLLKFLIGWLLCLPNVPDGVFFLQEDEVDIDRTEYQNFRHLLDSYSRELCKKCRRNCLVNAKEEIPDEVFLSPLKSQAKMNSRNVFAKTPSKNNFVSPLKTPSKFLNISMLDTPEVTPDKGNDEGDSQKLVLDSLPLVDYGMLLMCCPFIQELKSVLNDFALGNARSVGGVAVRKITPLAAPEKPQESSQKSVQMLLEENFFHNQPTSTKKTVDFVLERVFSNVVRSIRTVVIPRFKDDCLVKMKQFVAETGASSPSSKMTQLLEKKMSLLSAELASRVRKELELLQEKSLQDKILSVHLTFLLPVDVTENGLKICCQIVQRSVHERLQSWTNSHLNPEFCTQELLIEAQKYLKHVHKHSFANESDLMNSSVSFSSSANGPNCSQNSSLVRDSSSSFREDSTAEALSQAKSLFSPAAETDSQSAENPLKVQKHREDAPSPSILLSKVKSELKKLVTKSSEEVVDPSEVLRLIKSCLLHRQDMTVPLFRALEMLTADWMAALCVRRPESALPMLDSFCELWFGRESRSFYANASVLHVLLCPRTIMLVEKLPQDQQSPAWNCLKAALLRLVANDLLTPDQVQQKFISLMRFEWSQSILEGLSKAAADVSLELNRKGNSTEDVSLLDWVGWIASEINHFEQL